MLNNQGVLQNTSDAGFCGSCYGAEADPEDCCNSCVAQVHEAPTATFPRRAVQTPRRGRAGSGRERGSTESLCDYQPPWWCRVSLYIALHPSTCSDPHTHTPSWVYVPAPRFAAFGRTWRHAGSAVVWLRTIWGGWAGKLRRCARRVPRQGVELRQPGRHRAVQERSLSGQAVGAGGRGMQHLRVSGGEQGTHITSQEPGPARASLSACEAGTGGGEGDDMHSGRAGSA